MSSQVAPIDGFERFLEFAARQPLVLGVRRFVFLRHGETAGNAAGIFQTFDQPLNATGEAQARGAAEVLARHRVARFVASPMARAWRTACVAAERHGQTPVKHHDLHERLYTPLWGTTIGTIGWRDDPPGCETMDQFVTRTSAALTAVLAAPAPSGDIAVVSHGGLLVALMAQLGVELAPEARRNATPLLFTHDVGSWRAERLS